MFLTAIPFNVENDAEGQRLVSTHCRSYGNSGLFFGSGNTRLALGPYHINERLIKPDRFFCNPV